MPNNKHNSLELAQEIMQTLKAEGLLKKSAEGNSAVLTQLSNLLKEDEYSDIGVLTKNTTILLSDIRGFSSIAESYPATDVVKMLNYYFDCMGGIITYYGGHIDKLMGDSIMVVFGIPEEKPTDVENAIACAVEMQMAMSDINVSNLSLYLPELYMGIGINTGSVLAGELGSKYYHEHTIIGDEVNLTSRIEAQCLRGQILISENTYKHCKDFVEVGPPNKVQVKGANMAVDLYELFSTSRPSLMEVPRREERKSPRVKVNMPIIFQSLAGKIVLDEKFEGEAIDLSYRGLLIKSSVKLSVSSEIKMELSFDFFSERTTDVYARVINTKPEGDGYLSSIEFTTIDRQGLEAIKQYVDEAVSTG